ncbi:hypothetical protein EAE96_006233 [Botrytis aclada]|nr:hypothetical protein EAE96_006233 [Botrytis aclada]
MLMDRQTILPSAETTLNFYIRVPYGKRVGILMDVGEAAGYDCLHMWFLEVHSAKEKMLEKPESRHIKQFAQGEALEDLKDLVKTQIQPWIEACYNRQENHENCGRSVGTNILPTRLIDVGTLDNESTIQDAIILTRMMKIRYLWVDAICIVQSSENDDYSEFQTEASKLRDCYTNAECCIAASVPNDAAEGFFRKRLLGRYPIQSIFLTYPEGSSKKWETYDYAATATPRDILAMPDDKLLTHDGWHRLLRLVSEKGLTFSKDRIYAIHGIACLIIERLEVEYFNGVFRPYLAQGLAWNYSLRGPYDALPNFSVESRDDRFPTWCWASNGPAQFSDIPIGDSHSYIHDVHPQMSPTYPGNTNLTDDIDSKLHIKAPIIQIGLVYEHWEIFPPSGKVSIDCNGGEPLQHYFWV